MDCSEGGVADRVGELDLGGFVGLKCGFGGFEFEGHGASTSANLGDFEGGGTKYCFKEEVT